MKNLLSVWTGLARFRKWRGSKVRGIGPGMRNPRGWYIKWSPQWGTCINWFGGARLRIGRLHGVQLVVWRGKRWQVSKQILGKSRVVSERYVSEGKD